jgi:hypothetical protein
VFVAASDVTRPVFDGIPHVGELIFYVLAVATTLTFSYGVWRRVAKYRRGRPAGRGGHIREALLGKPTRGVRAHGDRGSVGGPGPSALPTPGCSGASWCCSRARSS